MVSILKTPTCEYVKAEIWQRNPTETNNIKLVFERCYGLSEIDRAIRVVQTYFQGQMGRITPTIAQPTVLPPWVGFNKGVAADNL